MNDNLFIAEAFESPDHTADVHALTSEVFGQRDAIAAAVSSMESAIEQTLAHIGMLATQVLALEAVVQELLKTAPVDRRAVEERLEAVLAQAGADPGPALRTVRQILGSGGDGDEAAGQPRP